MDKTEVFYTNDDDGLHIRCLLCNWEHCAGFGREHWPSLNDLTSLANEHICSKVDHQATQGE